MYLENATQKNFEKEIKKFGARLKNGGVGLFSFHLSEGGMHTSTKQPKINP